MQNKSFVSYMMNKIINSELLNKNPISGDYYHILWEFRTGLAHPRSGGAP